MKKTILCLLMAMTALLAINSCSSKEDDEKLKRLRELGMVEFFSEADPGKWKDHTGDHVPQCKVTFEKPKTFNKDDKGTRVIEVTVPFNGSEYPLHYTEAIILLDHNRKELQKTTFKRGNRKATALFRIPGDYKSFVYVVQKCNMHDMWIQQVSW